MWYDMQADDLTEHGMRVGVRQSRNILMFLSAGLMSRPFCQKEQRWGIKYDCKFVGIIEKDERHGRADFMNEKEAAPEDLKHLLDEVEFLDFQRREFQLQALIEEICRRGGCSLAPAGQDLERTSTEPVGMSNPHDSSLRPTSSLRLGLVELSGGGSDHGGAASATPISRAWMQLDNAKQRLDSGAITHAEYETFKASLPELNLRPGEQEAAARVRGEQFKFGDKKAAV